MAFNGNKSAVLGNDAVEVENQVSRLAAANPFALLRDDAAEQVENPVSRFTAVNGNKSHRYSDHGKGEKQQENGRVNGVKGQDNGVVATNSKQRNGHTNSSKKNEEAGRLINGQSSNGDASKKPEGAAALNGAEEEKLNDESSNDDGWQVIRRRQHEIGSGNNARPIVIRTGNNVQPVIKYCPPLVRVPSGEIPVTPPSNQVKTRVLKVKSNGRRDDVKPAAPLNKDQQRRPAAPLNKEQQQRRPAAPLSKDQQKDQQRRSAAPFVKDQQKVQQIRPAAPLNKDQQIRSAAPLNKDQQRRPAAPFNKDEQKDRAISTPDNRMRRRDSAPSNQIVNDKRDKHEQKEDNHVPKGDDVAREATKEGEFNRRGLMTLQAYGKIFEEKRKPLEALKPQEGARVVTPDKDFESMRVIEKKKEESIFIKLNSEKDKAKKKATMEKKALVTNFKAAGTNGHPGRRREESVGEIKSVKSYEELFPAFPVNGSTK